MELAPEDRYQIAPGWRIRREAFGGLAYHHRTGRLVVLSSPLVWALLQNDGTATVAEMVEKVVAEARGTRAVAAETLARARERLLVLLSDLANKGVITRCEDAARD
ncbi:MAG: mycofactocin biosynthesis chaperone MftB [Firmicutes bacterium]|nr:mycofactocin biosynthesis chaperone MftB [Alicyclobacillaceae bacterium]MCL6497533.1 mycofactocin biosynthesis chaperone MftB [Bacillota bacterium]